MYYGNIVTCAVICPRKEGLIENNQSSENFFQGNLLLKHGQQMSEYIDREPRLVHTLIDASRLVYFVVFDHCNEPKGRLA